MIEYHADGTLPDPTEGWIFVFGSNLKGIHGAGAAKVAREAFGAKYGCGVGRCGNSYAIPTKNENLHTLSLTQIKFKIRDFIDYVKTSPDEKFWITRVGCGLAGYKNPDIAPLFKGLTETQSRISLPTVWENFL